MKLEKLNSVIQWTEGKSLDSRCMREDSLPREGPFSAGNRKDQRPNYLPKIIFTVVFSCTNSLISIINTVILLQALASAIFCDVEAWKDLSPVFKV